MAFEQLFVRSKRSLAGIQLDAIISERHNNSVRTTENPVEIGADITDNSTLEATQLTIIAEVTDTPLGTAALGVILDNITGVFGRSTPGGNTRSITAYNALLQIMRLREPIQVQTKLVLYDNMLITNIDVLQDKDSSRSVLLNISLREIFTTESEIVQLDPKTLSGATTVSQASSAENLGRKAASTPKPATNKSVLKSIKDWIEGS